MRDFLNSLHLIAKPNDENAALESKAGHKKLLRVANREWSTHPDLPHDATCLTDETRAEQDYSDKPPSSRISTSRCGPALRNDLMTVG